MNHQTDPFSSRHSCRGFWRSFWGTALITFTVGANAGVSQTPLTVIAGAKPNIMLVIDDSGNMDFELLMPTNDGALWWQTGNKSFYGSGRNGETNAFNYNRSGAVGTISGDATGAQWKKYVYLFPSGTATGNRVYGDGTHDNYAVPPTTEFAFARSSQYNPLYYDPTVTYEPWIDGGGYTFANASPTNAKTDPIYGSTTFDLTRDLSDTHTNWKFRAQVGMRKSDGSLATTDSSLTYSYFPATYYMRTTDSLTVLTSYNCASPDPAAYTAFRANPSALTGVDAIAPDGYCLKAYPIKATTPSYPSGRSYAGELQNFANWFQYHRKRHLALRAGMGRAIEDITSARMGAFTVNNRVSVTMRDLDDAAQRTQLFKQVYEIGGSSGSPLNREGLLFAGQQFNSNANVIQYSCQQNFALQFTAGFSVPNAVASVGNADGTLGSPFADRYSGTLADVASYYYNTTLRSDLNHGNVPVSPLCSTAPSTYGIDCNDNLHMNTYGLTLGGQGDIFGVTHNIVTDAYTNPVVWQDPNNSEFKTPVQIDDLYHAAINGHGQMLNASSPTELQTGMHDALLAILDQVTSSASAVAANSTRLDTDTLVYQARFDSSNWSGQLLAFKPAADGEIVTPQWDAGTLIGAADTRRIFTLSPYVDAATAQQKLAFQWSQLTAAQHDALNLDSSGAADNLGEQRVAYLRGETSGERRLGGSFRNRSVLLGDIVNSSPWFVGKQSFSYDRLPLDAAGQSSYAAFQAGPVSRRRPMIYVGANDGMLHGFDAATGREQFAIVPSEVIPYLVQLTDPAYSHRYFVDGSPVAGDAYFATGWKTVLATSLGAGGRSILAVDITDPDSVDQNSILWEYHHADLGHVLGRVSIARMANGRWAVLFGNGYDVAAGGQAAARLFIVDLETGALIKAISTVRSQDEASAVVNALASPFPVDTNNDAITDVIYAGDLYGNLWKFDVRSSNTGSWDVDYAANGAPSPLFTACASGDASGPFGCAASARQPITMRPVVGVGPNNTLVVYFGTGKFYEISDTAVLDSDPVQSFYSIRDTNTGNSNDRVAGRSELGAQQITGETTLDGKSVRITSNDALAANAKGWYLDLVSPVNGFEGERAVSQPVLRGGRLIFTTIIPSRDACSSGGTGWLMEMTAESGGRFDYPVLDINEDGAFTNADEVTVNNGNSQTLVAPSGRHSEIGVIQTPAIIQAGAVEYKITGGSSGEVESVREHSILSKGRGSWRQQWPKD